MTPTQSQPAVAPYRECACPHCRELARVSSGLWAAHGLPRPHTEAARELVRAWRDVRGRLEGQQCNR